MRITTVNLVYFSATFTTRKIVRLIASQMSDDVKEYDITMNDLPETIHMNDQEVLIVGMPVYAGRIPKVAAERLKRLKGNNTPTIIVCVYGNREYDDALLELKDVVVENGFKVISAGAFIAQHSIFPAVGANRPGKKDKEKIKRFAHKSVELLYRTDDFSILPDIDVKGNRPYKVPGAIPLHPNGGHRCDKCGNCVKLCPVQAIPEDKPRQTDKEKCIACGRCIVVCPRKTRRFRGIVYKLAGYKFKKANAVRKEPETVFAQ